jgi:hypothetical protein
MSAQGQQKFPVRAKSIFTSLTAEGSWHVRTNDRFDIRRVAMNRAATEDQAVVYAEPVVIAPTSSYSLQHSSFAAADAANSSESGSVVIAWVAAWHRLSR